MYKQTLYKRNSNQSIQEWTIIASGGKFMTIEGLVDGKKTPSKWTMCEAKNVGKISQTTPEQQAVKEAQSKMRSKVDEGYTADINNIDNMYRFKPMLAHEYKDYKHRITYPCYMQPKLDGIRSLKDKVCSKSREGKVQNSAPHIYEIISGLFKIFPDLTVDGELYNHKLRANFDEISSMATTQKLSKEDVEKSEQMLQYHVYDLFFSEKPEMVFSERKRMIESIIEGIHQSVVVVKTIKVMNAKMADKVYEMFLNQGYEGAIIRMNTPYVQVRTPNLLKRKEFIEEEFEIVGIDEGKGNRAGTAGAVWAVKDGKRFKGGVMGNMKFFKKLWDNKEQYIGQIGTFRYQNLTPKGVPRFGRLKAIRDYE